MEDSPDTTGEPQPADSSKPTASRAWRWLWLLVPVVLAIGLYLWIEV